MTTYTDAQQRQMDAQSGQEIDRRAGHSRLVYNKTTRTIVSEKDYRHVEAGAPGPVDAPYVVLATPAYERLRAELEEATLARGRLRLWLEFIHLNCASADAKEFAGEALIGAHVPDGFDAGAS